MANQVVDIKLIHELNNNNDPNGQDHSSDSMIVRSNEDPRKLIPELCKHFYHLGWASGKHLDHYNCNCNCNSDIQSINLII